MDLPHRRLASMSECRYRPLLVLPILTPAPRGIVMMRTPAVITICFPCLAADRRSRGIRGNMVSVPPPGGPEGDQHQASERPMRASGNVPVAG